MKIKYALTILYVIYLVTLGVFLVKTDSALLSSSYLWIAYSAFLILTLPSLISKAFFSSPFIGFTSAMCFLYYPIAYGVIYFLSSFNIFEFAWLSAGFTIFTLLYWNYLVLFLLIKLKNEYLKLVFKQCIKLIPILMISLIILGLFIRQVDSVLALDYVQHQTVVTAINSGEKLCTIPNDCSNLFLQVGYSTFYHFILGTVGSFTANNLNAVFYVLDFVWLLVFGIVVYKLFIKNLKNQTYAVIGAFLTTLIFTTGAYENIFFLPQTLSFILFLIILSSNKLNFLKVILSSLLLILAHFIIGFYLSVILIIYYFLISLYLDNSKTLKSQRLFVYAGLLVTIFVFLLHVLGFSIENNFQRKEVEVIGEFTNYTYPQSIHLIELTLGPISILLLLALINYLFSKKSRYPFMTFSFVFICISISAYLLGPTYANKFLIGFGVFGIYVITEYISKSIKSKSYKLVIFIFIAISIGLNFTLQYKKYEDFYKQDNGDRSVIVKEDDAIKEFFNNYDSKCIVLSDPYTQIIIAGFTDFSTANAQYMELDSRRTLVSFITNPSDETYSKLINITELKPYTNEDICFVYTSRLDEAIKTNQTYWTENIYSYILENNYPIRSTVALRGYLDSIGYKIVFNNPNFIVFAKE